MKLYSLLVLVLVQIASFQFLMLRMVRTLPEQLLGLDNLPDALRLRVDRFLAEVGKGRRLLGAALILAALVLTLTPLIADPGHRKLALAAVSLTSSLAMGLGWVKDTRWILARRGEIVEGPARAVSLEPRRLSQHYPLHFEALPVAVLLATLAISWQSWTGEPAPVRAALLYFGIPLLQALFVLGSWLLVRWLAAKGLPLGPRALARQDEPLAAIDRGLMLRRLDLRYFLGARVGIALLLALMQLQQILASRGDVAPAWLDLGNRILVIVLMLVFAAHLIQLARFERSGR